MANLQANETLSFRELPNLHLLPATQNLWQTVSYRHQGPKKHKQSNSNGSKYKTWEWRKHKTHTHKNFCAKGNKEKKTHLKLEGKKKTLMPWSHDFIFLFWETKHKWEKHIASESLEGNERQRPITAAEGASAIPREWKLNWKMTGAQDKLKRGWLDLIIHQVQRGWTQEEKSSRGDGNVIQNLILPSFLLTDSIYSVRMPGHVISGPEYDQLDRTNNLTDILWPVVRSGTWNGIFTKLGSSCGMVKTEQETPPQTFAQKISITM